MLFKIFSLSQLIGLFPIKFRSWELGRLPETAVDEISADLLFRKKSENSTWKIRGGVLGGNATELYENLNCYQLLSIVICRALTCQNVSQKWKDLHKTWHISLAIMIFSWTSMLLEILNPGPEYILEFFWSGILHNNYILFRSSRPEVFCRKGVLKHFTKFTWKHLCQSQSMLRLFDTLVILVTSRF